MLCLWTTREATLSASPLQRGKLLGSLAVGDSGARWVSGTGGAASHPWPLQRSAYRVVDSVTAMPASFAIAEKMPCFMSSSSGLSNSTICPACSTITLAEGNKKA